MLSKTTMSFEEIDKTIQQNKQYYEIKNFIENDKLPDKFYSEVKVISSTITPINELIPLFNNHKIKPINLTPHINKCNNIIKVIQDMQDNMCAICYEDIEINNCVTPKCNHKVCIQCYSKNLILNKNGNKCATCRQIIFKI
jgi:hypothetical protein